MRRFQSLKTTIQTTHRLRRMIAKGHPPGKKIMRWPPRIFSAFGSWESCGFNARLLQHRKLTATILCMVSASARFFKGVMVLMWRSSGRSLLMVRTNICLAVNVKAPVLITCVWCCAAILLGTAWSSELRVLNWCPKQQVRQNGTQFQTSDKSDIQSL